MQHVLCYGTRLAEKRRKEEEFEDEQFSMLRYELRLYNMYLLKH